MLRRSHVLQKTAEKEILLTKEVNVEPRHGHRNSGVVRVRKRSQRSSAVLHLRTLNAEAKDGTHLAHMMPSRTICAVRLEPIPSLVEVHSFAILEQELLEPTGFKKEVVQFLDLEIFRQGRHERVRIVLLVNGQPVIHKVRAIASQQQRRLMRIRPETLKTDRVLAKERIGTLPRRGTIAPQAEAIHRDLSTTIALILDLKPMPRFRDQQLSLVEMVTRRCIVRSIHI